jgi:hypothetical protein
VPDVTRDARPDVIAGSLAASRDPERLGLARAFVATTSPPGAVPRERSPRSCLTLRVPRQRLRHVLAHRQLRIKVRTRESGHVDVFVVYRPHTDIASESFAEHRGTTFGRPGGRRLRLTVTRDARRRVSKRRYVRVTVEVTQFSRRSDDIRTVRRRVVLR